MAITVLSPADCLANISNLKGKVVIITGAGSGFGREAALRFASYGAHVVVSDLNMAPLESLVKEIERNHSGSATAFAPCDTTNWEQQLAMFKHAERVYGHVDIVFPNAGVGETGEWLETTLDVAGDPRKPNQLTTNVNLLSVSYSVYLAFHYLRKNPATSGKAIVFIGSRYSTIPIPAGPMYTTAKHGVMGLFKSTYGDAQSDGISTNIILPWFCETGIIAPLTRVAIFALPVCKIEDVIHSVVKSASDPTFAGNSVFIDADGIVAVPFTECALGESGYYRYIANRAIYKSSPARILKDANLLIRQSLGFWLRTRLAKLKAVTVIALLVMLIRRRRTTKN